MLLLCISANIDQLALKIKKKYLFKTLFDIQHIFIFQQSNVEVVIGIKINVLEYQIRKRILRSEKLNYLVELQHFFEWKVGGNISVHDKEGLAIVVIGD